MKMLVPTAGPKPAQENANYILDMASKLKAEVAVLHILDIGEFDEGRNAINHATSNEEYVDAIKQLERCLIFDIDHSARAAVHTQIGNANYKSLLQKR